MRQKPIVLPLVIDRISFTLTYPDDKWLLVNEPIGKLEEQGFLCKTPAAYQTSKRYQHYRAVMHKKREVALLQWRPLMKGMRFMRVSLNPNAIGPEALKLILRILKEIFGVDCRSVMALARISELHIAIDVLHVQIDDLLLADTHKSRSQKWGVGFYTSGETQTVNLGAPKSDRRMTIYNWNTKHLDDPSSAPAKTRFEWKSSSQRIWPHTLSAVPNPFSQLQVSVLSKFKLEKIPYDGRWFLDSCRVRGAQGALKLIPNYRTRKRYANRLFKRQPVWWVPDIQWAGLEQAVRDTGLFPKEAFIKPDAVQSTVDRVMNAGRLPKVSSKEADDDLSSIYAP